MEWVVVVVGPTAVGKSALALTLAQKLNGEIVSADSRQVYRYLDIGTAKPTPQERAQVPHHLIDVVNPDETFTLALFLEKARHAIEDIQLRGRLPLVVGGSGQYIWALVEGWQVPQVPPDEDLRRRLEERAAGEGVGALFRELEQIDPQAAERIDPNNRRRVIRALEVWYGTGTPFSRLQGKIPPPFKCLIVGLTARRDVLYQRIDARIDVMVERGLVAEVEGVVTRGYSLALPPLQGMGYREMGLFLHGQMDLATAVSRFKYRSHDFARHQYAWFRPRDERIHWLDTTGRSSEELCGEVLELLSGLEAGIR
ncbi:MAG: tRNA (adenosine(37)-N6)-dimethylallyltransferase MiaA [Chloroflexi bacterium]|nr:tRNA (adenosine(37)-N6)-dimethylallyltransferase MiaA [Chloroflexota bacterium]